MMVEYGVTYANGVSKFSFGYLYCAFKYKNKLYISDACNHRVVIINTDDKSFRYIHHGDWFPRWIQPIGENIFVFLDSKKKKIGIVDTGDIVFETEVFMEEPRFITKTNKETYLVGGRGEKPLIEYDSNFNIVGKYLNHTFNLQSAEYIDDERLLICDIDRHQVLICTLNGDVVWQYGKESFPGEYLNELSSPKYACYYDRSIYIADGKNNRILSIDLNSGYTYVYKGESSTNCLWWPTCVQILSSNIVITDAANCRVIETDPYWSYKGQWGTPRVKNFALNNPRGIELLNDSFLVADTYNHRILRFDKALNMDIFYGGKRGSGANELFWPRAIRYDGKNKYWIADSRNSRLIEIDKIGNVYNVFYGFMFKGRFYNFGDPHDIDYYDGKLLVTDSKLNIIIQLDLQGNCLWMYGEHGELNDPHSARKTADSGVLISDTRNNRVVKLSHKGEIVQEIKNISNGKLKMPRWSEEVESNVLIVDSGNNRVILTDYFGNIIKQIEVISSENQLQMKTPRCARKIGDSIIISDTQNNRILKFNF